MRLRLRVEKGGPGSGFHGHAGRPGKVGGSTSVYIGAKPLDHYMDIVNNSPLMTRERWGAESYQYRAVPRDSVDSSVYIGLENTSRLCQENYGMNFDEYVKLSEDEFRKQLAESDVYMRITPENLEEALDEGSFENTFTSKTTGAKYRENKVSYKKYMAARKEGERDALGVPLDAAGEDRPIYGFWSKEGGATEHFDIFLGQYGSITVMFDKSKIANSLTFTDSDSLDLSTRVRSSDWRHPSILSSFGITNMTYVPDIAKSGPDAGTYWEAQIFDKRISNIKSIISTTPLPQSLIDKLNKAGIPWSIK